MLMKEFVTVKDVGSDKACNFKKCLVYLRNRPEQRVKITPVEIRKAERAGLLDPGWFAGRLEEKIIGLGLEVAELEQRLNAKIDEIIKGKVV